MRVRFGELRASERKRLAELDARIERLVQEARFKTGDADWWKRSIRTLVPGLEAELWDDGRVIVRGRTRELLPVAQRVASAFSPGLRIETHRPPRDLASALSNVQAHCSVDLTGARFRAGFSRGHLLEIVLLVAGGSANQLENSAAQQLVWQVLGERLANAWVGAVRVAPGPRAGPLRVIGPAAEAALGLELAALNETVQAAVAGLYSTLPSVPAWACKESAQWTLFELEPEPARDWSAQDDLLMTTTSEPELLKCYLSGAAFSSERFSRLGELFFYLKFQPELDFEARLTQRAQLEDALDRALIDGRAGRVIGGGLGLRYSYVDMVLAEPDRGMEITRGIARSAALSRSSWVLPFDADLASEWVEIWPKAPPPPGLRAAPTRLS